MRIRKLLVVVGLLAVLAVGLLAGRALEKMGNPDSPSGPATTFSYTLEDIYNRLAGGAAGGQSAFTEPTVGPGTGTMHTLNDIMGMAPVKDNTNGATIADVFAGKKFWGLTGGQWGEQTGGLATQAVDNSTVNQAAGYYDAFDLSAVDTDLVSGNIRSGVSIYGVAGNPNVVNTSSGDATAADIASGKKAWVDGSEVSGELHGGCTCNGTLYANRWCDNEDGTVTDLTTCLVWLKKADWGGLRKWRCSDSDTDSYDDAHARAGLLYAGASGTDLSDSSVEGDWRLPTKTELEGLANGTEAVRSGDMQAFTGVQAHNYWSSTTSADFTNLAWVVYMGNGVVGHAPKNFSYYVWPVRAGQ